MLRSSNVDLSDEARKARDAAAAQGGRKSAAYSGGYTTETGEVAAGCSGKDKCAEDDVVEKLGGDKEKVQFVEAARSRKPDNKEQPICVRCQGKYRPDQFPPGVQYEPDEPWSTPPTGGK